MYYQGQLVLCSIMGMDHHTTITVHEDTHLALKRICEVYGYDSMHHFVLEQVLEHDEDSEETAIPVGLRRSLEQKASGRTLS
jgi:hypothetical protein